MTEGPARSRAAREASRKNGARSTGPRSHAGKQASARNSVKHGLFSSRTHVVGAMSCVDAPLSAVLDGVPAEGWHAHALIETAVMASSQFAQAAALVRQALERIDVLLSKDVLDIDLLTLRAEDLVRFGRYERRFRGRRDRALRKLTAGVAGQD